MKASIFVTCIVDSFYPQVGEAMVRVLEKSGVQLEFPESQVCCGQPAYNTGYWDETRQVAKTLLEAFKNSEYVVAPSGSCVAAIREYYPIIFEKDPEYLPLARELVQKTYEFSEFMVKVLQISDVGARFPHKVTYHASCHGNRLLGVTPYAKKLLAHVKDMQLLELPHAETCCGFGGTFSVKQPEISEAMVDEKVHHIKETGADVVTAIDMGCLMNIEGRLKKEGSPIRTLHLAQLLDEGMRQ
ncbi:(Fe-S)-binding protein [Desulfotomaculum defluvii]